VSGKLAMSVFNSRLPAPLKRLAALLALWGSDDGDRIFPSVGTLARQLGCDPRTVKRQRAALITLGVLQPVTPRTGGRAKTTRYQLDLAPLTHAEKGDATVTLFEDKRVTPVTGKGDPGVPRSVSDPLVQRSPRTPLAGGRSRTPEKPPTRSERAWAEKVLKQLRTDPHTPPCANHHVCGARLIAERRSHEQEGLRRHRSVSTKERRQQS
jgi:hypothetical protein